jgi:predicted transcriptional regulator
VVESLASLSGHSSKKIEKVIAPTGIKYCRSCYDHLAGRVGVKITEALVKKKAIRKHANSYLVTTSGWKLLAGLDISKSTILTSRRPLARQCLDWSERRPHIAGQVGAMLLNNMLEKGWFRRMKFSRELIITSKGRSEINKLLNIEI